MGQNISVVMPALLGQSHNRFIQAYLCKTQTTLGDSLARIVLAQHIRGFLVPCNLLVRLVPNLDRGIQFIGFVTKAACIDSLRFGESNVSSDEAFIFLLDHEYRLHGFNKPFVNLLGVDYDELNIQKYLENDQKFDMLSYLGGIFAEDKEGMLTQLEGYETCLNLTPLVELLQTEISEYAHPQDSPVDMPYLLRLLLSE
jgi:hypothetical protein